VRDWHKKGEARYAIDRSRNAILVEPQSYMNLSGRPVQSIATFYKVPPQRMLVIVDDLDLPFGKLRMRADGSSGGHNGLKSLIEVFGQGFPRLRIGIGRGHDPDAIDRVLGDFSDSERKELPAIVDRAIAGVESWLADGVTPAMNLVNAKV
jgi:PTH1 family peptidyl-tRNA hydrolase